MPMAFFTEMEKKSCNLFGTMKDTNSNTILSKGTKKKYYIMLPKNILQSIIIKTAWTLTVKLSARGKNRRETIKVNSVHL